MFGCTPNETWRQNMPKQVERKHVCEIYLSEIEPSATYVVRGFDITRSAWWMKCRDRGWCNIMRSREGILTLSIRGFKGPTGEVISRKLEISGKVLRDLMILLDRRGFIRETIDITVSGPWNPLSPEDRERKRIYGLFS